MSAPPAGAPAVRPSSSPRRAVSALLERVPALTLSGDAETVVTGCTLDSRTVRAGDLYAALPGARVHGARFLADVVAAGATAVLTDPEGAEQASSYDVAVLVADDPRAVLGDLAACVYGDPAERLLVIGVTGTNGKTTTAFLLEAGLREAGHTTGLLGTVETRIAGEVVGSERTTPEAPDLQALLAVMVERGVTAVAMEVSSHALVLGRVDGLVFDTAVFTNLSQDHLDFHPTMEDYYAAKASLFTPRRCKRAVLNVEDPAGRRLAADATVPVTTFGSGADLHAELLEVGPGGSSFRLVGEGVDVPVEVALPGAFNVSNTVAALAALHVSGVDVSDAAAGVAALTGVPGRMERVDVGQPFLAVVDYAHTPEAVQTLLAAVRDVVEGRVIAVLGCGGDRDRAKRPLMGAALAAGSDVAICTSDNPRSEDPQVILDEMSAGAPGAEVLLDRRAAIARAVALAGPGDAVVIAGKGHELGQEVAGVVTPFDDRLVLRELLEQVPA